MAFPALTISNGTDAQSQLVNQASAAGLTEPTNGLSMVDMIAATVANLLKDLPATCNVALSTAITTSSASGIKSSAGAAATADTSADKINFAVIKGVAA